MFALIFAILMLGAFACKDAAFTAIVLFLGGGAATFGLILAVCRSGKEM